MIISLFYFIDVSGHGLLPFIRSCLQNKKYTNVIQWTGQPSAKEFKFVNLSCFASMWGKEKGKEGMSPRKLNRSLSYLVKNKRKLKKSVCRKNVYTITTDVDTPEVESKEFKPIDTSSESQTFDTKLPSPSIFNIVNPNALSQSKPLGFNPKQLDSFFKSIVGNTNSSNAQGSGCNKRSRTKLELSLLSPASTDETYEDSSSTASTPVSTTDDLFFLLPTAAKKAKVSSQDNNVADNIQVYSKALQSLPAQKKTVTKTISAPPFGYSTGTNIPFIANLLDSKTSLNNGINTATNVGNIDSMLNQIYPSIVSNNDNVTYTNTFLTNTQAGSILKQVDFNNNESMNQVGRKLESVPENNRYINNFTGYQMYPSPQSSQISSQETYSNLNSPEMDLFSDSYIEAVDVGFDDLTHIEPSLMNDDSSGSIDSEIPWNKYML